MKAKRPTIRDIAKEAGLSPSTVSRALSNHPRISKKTKQKIINLAKSMGYQPNLFARGLVKNKTYLLGLLVYDFRNTFYAELTRAVQEEAEELGYWVIQASTDDDPDKAALIAESMINLGVEGLVYASCQLEDKMVEGLLEDKFPVALANRRLKSGRGDYVVCDNQYGAFQVVNHLIHLGYEQIGMIHGPLNLSTSVDRYEGFIQAHADAGLEFNPDLIRQGAYSRETGYTQTRRLMRTAYPPSAIFCTDDTLALGSLEALGEMGIEIPQEVGVVGFDDQEISSHPLIQLTTVSQDAKAMGRTAARMVIRRIEENPEGFDQRFIEPRLIIRGSCGYKLRQGSRR